MRLIRFGARDAEKPGILSNSGQRKDCSALFADWDRSFFRAGGLNALMALDEKALPNVPDDARWAPCVARPGKILCVGANYAEHAKESGKDVPPEPLIFQKAVSAVCGPYDPILIPRDSVKTDYEVELALIVGKDCRYLDSPEEARRHIAGYLIVNDVSERAFQKERQGQWTKGKSCDNFCPMGPFLAVNEITLPAELSMVTKVNGEIRQNGNTREMVYKPDFLVYYLSRFMTLEAGDMISTGTPSGVGMGMTPPRFLKTGDIVELAVQWLGTQRQVCENA